jgi:hypothetical protein
MAETQALPRLGSRKTSPQEHVPIPSTRDAEPKGCLSGEASMGMTDDDDTVYCNVQMPLTQG